MSRKFKKVLSGILALSMLATPVLSVNAEVIENVLPIEKPEILYGDIEPELYGDINGDGVVDNSDVDILKKAILGIGSLTEFEFYCADLNGDGKLNSFDLTKLSKLVKEKRNLRVVENCDEIELDTTNMSGFIYAYNRYHYSLGIHSTDYENGKPSKIYIKPYFYLNGVKHNISTALRNETVTIDEIMAVNKDVYKSLRSYYNFHNIKVIPPADDIEILPAIEFLYNDGKYDYYFNNILSGLYVIEIYGKQYTLREVIDKKMLTPGEMVYLGLFDSKVSAPFEKIETIEIYDPYKYDPDKDPNDYMAFPEAIQVIYQDEEHGYVLGALYGEYVTVTINGIDFSLKEVLQNELLTIHELIDAGFSVGIVDVDEVFNYHFTL